MLKYCPKLCLVSLLEWCIYNDINTSIKTTDKCTFRIQQIQLLGRDMKGAEHDKLWNQLEAEIHLHRHKTVIRACRGRTNRKKRLPIPPGHVRNCLLLKLH